MVAIQPPFFYLSGVRIIGIMIGSRSVFSYKNGRKALTIAPLTDWMLASLFLRAIRIALNRMRLAFADKIARFTHVDEATTEDVWAS